MSKITNTNKFNKKVNNNKDANANDNNKALNNNYNVIINQNSTFNQDNSINIMLDSTFPYFLNYNYQSNESDPSNPIIPFYQDYQPKNNQNYQNKERKDSNNNIKNTTENKKNNDNKNNEIPKDKNLLSLKNDRKATPKKSQDDLQSYEEMYHNSTNKIDYRYVKKCPIKEMISNYKKEENENDSIIKDKDHHLFWLATYGKLMKTKHLLKIFNYYNNRPFEDPKNNYSNPNFKEKTLIIKDFEIYFYENSNKPFIRYSKGGTIYTKLYLLTLREISLIFSYMNRIEYKINYEELNYLQRKGTFKIINENHNGIILPYCLIYCLGKYMNINIYSFSHNINFNSYLDEISFQNNQRISSYTAVNNNKNDNNYFNNDNNQNVNNTHIKTLNYKLPNSKKIAKLVKIINLNFPDFSIDDIINYLIPDNKYINSFTKINEIKNIFFFKKSIQSKAILSSMVRDTIRGISIPTPQSLISSFCPGESILDNNSHKNSDLFQPTNKKYQFPIKDDYKFQTISANEKENNNNEPFIINVYDNIQRNIFNENFSNKKINENSFNKIDSSSNKIKNENIPQNKNQNISQIRNNDDNISSNNNKNQINNNNNKSIKENKEKMNPKLKSIETKKKVNKYGKDINNVFMTDNKKNMKIHRITTDVREKMKSCRFNTLIGDKNCRNKIRDSKAISHTNFAIDNNTNGKRPLNKSIESQNNYSAKWRLSKASEISQKKKQKSKNMLINRINMIKKDINNPFVKPES